MEETKMKISKEFVDYISKNCHTMEVKQAIKELDEIFALNEIVYNADANSIYIYMYICFTPEELKDITDWVRRNNGALSVHKDYKGVRLTITGVGIEQEPSEEEIEFAGFNHLLEQDHHDLAENVWDSMSPAEKRKMGLQALKD